MNRFEKKSVNINEIRNNDRNMNQYYNNLNYNNKIKRPYSGYDDNYRNKIKKNNSFSKIRGNNNNNLQQNYSQENKYFDDEDDDGEIKMIYNTGNNANVIETKINKENNMVNNDISNNAAFNEFKNQYKKYKNICKKKLNKKNNLDSKNNDVIFLIFFIIKF